MSHPLIAIVGTTGVGKSRLAVDLAQAVAQFAPKNETYSWNRARVLNADAMQVYRGLNVITNKIPEEEQLGVEHCLMGFKDPGEEFVVGEWVRDAVELIDQSHRERTIPIVAGGTLYWVQHLIFPERLASNAASDPEAAPPSPSTTISEALKKSLSNLPEPLRALYEKLPDRGSVLSITEDEAFSLHTLLSHLDPDMAARWHWRDSRKILRSLEIIQEAGDLASRVMRQQDASRSTPRYNTLIFWIYAEPRQLDPRLDARVDTMLQMGLINELFDLREIASKLSPSGSDQTPDFTQGIFQAIGYKEFAPYLREIITASKENGTEVPALRSCLTPSSSQLFASGLDLMKLSTRQYARKQVKWVQNRLIPAVNASASLLPLDVENEQFNTAKLFLLDATELGNAWERNVRDVAISVLHKFLTGTEELPDPRTLSPVAERILDFKKETLQPSATLEARRKRTCLICTTEPSRPVMIEEGREWEVHVKTRAHRKRENLDKHLEFIRVQREAHQKRMAERETIQGEGG